MNVLLNQISRAAALSVALFSLMILISCGGGDSTSSPANSPTPGAANPASPQPATPQATVVMVMEENHSYEQVIGNASMPYLNSLAQQGAVATQYYANAHPSIGNYFALTTGAVQTNDNNFPGPLSSDNLARELSASGQPWTVYAEDLPSAGY